MELLIITGPPYSGKGTQCEFIEEQLGYQHVSTGELCRAEKKKNTSLGKLVAEYNVKGDLVPDHIMKQLLSIYLDENNQEKPIILDGYPRTKDQVNDLEELLQLKEIQVSTVLNIEVPENLLLERAKKRAETSDREDDKDPEIHIKRVLLFQEETLPSIEYMKSKFTVTSINGVGTKEEIFVRVRSKIQ